MARIQKVHHARKRNRHGCRHHHRRSVHVGGPVPRGLFINLGPGTYETLAEAQEAGAATINYGLFVSAVISFLIVALVVFLLVKALARMQEEEETPSEPTSKECPECLSEIPIQARRCAFCTTVLESA